MPPISDPVNGRPPKLRAACDACSESKVRCSQGKPACTRCEKNSIRCIYGLSRRSHKSATRIGGSSSSSAQPVHSTAPATGPSSCASSPPQPQLSQPCDPGQETHGSMDTIFETGTSCFNMSPMQYFRDFVFEDTTLAAPVGGAVETFLLDSVNGHCDFTHTRGMLSENSQSLLLDTPSAECETGPRSITAVEHLDKSLSAVTPDVGHLLSPNIGNDTRTPKVDGRCDCASRLISSLLTLQSPCPRDHPPFDVQLSRLRKATKLSEDCMSCSCQMSDGIVTVTNGILLYRIIQGFESALALARAEDQGPVQHQQPDDREYCRMQTQNSRAPSPQLLWGAMQFDQDEMQDLKPHLWLLQFRKVEKRIESLGESVAKMRTFGAQMKEGEDNIAGNPRSNTHSYGSSSGGIKGGNDGNSALVMACECIHMWLNQRAKALRDKYLA